MGTGSDSTPRLAHRAGGGQRLRMARSRPNDPQATNDLVRALEERFTRITLLAYDTRVSVEQLETELMPYVASDVLFVDPWQSNQGREHYRAGAAGFHCLFRFDFELRQLHVRLEPDGRRGRALVDGVMQLRQLDALFVYPLRTLLTYEFTVDEAGNPSIHRHEEMWSFGDMLEAVPLFGAFYSRLFRPGFSKGFLAASAFCRRLRAR